MSALIIAQQKLEPRCRGAKQGISMEPKSIARTLYEQAKAGDAAAYEELFGQCADRLLMFIRLRMGSLQGKVEAEDILQDAYLSAHRGFAEFQYESDGAFLRWLCCIVDHRLRDSVDYFAASKRQPVVIPRSTQTGPFTALKRMEQQQQIEQAIRSMSPEHQRVLLLRYFQGLSAEEAGQAMGKSANAIRSLTARALSQLGQHLSLRNSSS